MLRVVKSMDCQKESNMYNISDEKLIQMFEAEPIDVWINSFGGCRSNYIRDSIKDEYRTYNQAYELKACHYIKPLDVPVGSGIFCYVEDVGIALSSQLERGMEHNYQKLMEGDTFVKFRLQKWLGGIDKQIDNWVTNPYFPTVIINTDKVMEYKNEFKEIYGVELLPYKERDTKEYHPSLKSYTDIIETINEKLSDIADFTFIDYPSLNRDRNG